MTKEILSLAAIEDLSFQALTGGGCSPENARPLAAATASTEAEGIASHGLAYIPIYCEHVQCGKVDGQAKPVLTQTAGATLTVDAKTGFAHPAIDLGFEALIPLAKQQGIACLAIRNSYNCGVLGIHTRQLARSGLLALGFTNAPASIAASGGKTAVVGTNPISIAAPDENGNAAILVDQSASTIAKSEVMKHAREGREMPLGWAIDPEGNPTTDPELGLKGTMSPSGGYKGVGIALVVELLAAAASGATLGKYASPFSGTAGGPPRTGQFFIAIDPRHTSGGNFQSNLSALVQAFHSEEGARLPGEMRTANRRRAEREGVAVLASTLDRIRAIINA